MLKNMKVGVRLALSFVIMIALIATIAVLSLTRLNALNDSMHLLIEDRFPKVLQVSDAINQVNVIARALRNMLLWEDPEEIEKEAKRIEEARAATTEIIKELEAEITSDEGERLLKEMNAARVAYIAPQDRIIAFAQQGLRTEAIALLLGEYRNLQNAYIGAFENLKTFQVDLANAAGHEAQAMTTQTLTLLVILGVAAALLALLLAILITNSIVKPLATCITAATRIGKGDLDITIDPKGKDELAALQREMAGMIATLRGLIEQMNHMSGEHDAGDIDVRIEESRFQGAYAEMAKGVNLMVFGHIAVKKKAMACVLEFGKGNFEAPLEKFPGKKAFINDTIEQVRTNLKALITDADMLATAAVEGRLATRADASKHYGDFRKIVDGVNRTLDLVVGPVNETIAIMKRLAEGDLTATMTGDYRGDFDILKTALNDSLESINDTLSQVNTAVEQVAEGSQQVSQASQSLSQGATEQAASLEEITSSITEISGQTKQNTENAVQVNGLAKEAKSSAEQGNVQMKDLVAAMSDINTSAEGIKTIVKAIDDISFQINLLALNANVEAARAGKYGKGFAVVAEEVRNLAVRSANSVKDTTRMVDEAIANIDRGNKLVGVTAKQLGSIVEGAGKVASLAEEVSVASKEQTQGLEQISLGLTQIDQVTQSNTASAEESASAAEELSSQSQQVKAMLARFRLRAREAKMSNQDMVQMLRAELARQQHAARVPAGAPAGAPRPAAATAAAPKPRRVNPADVISLDDDNFGKF